MMDALEIITQANFWAAAIRIATPLIFGVLGALICERAGVLNLGIEGIFVAGAMSGWLAVYLGAVVVCVGWLFFRLRDYDRRTLAIRQQRQAEQEKERFNEAADRGILW